MKLTGKCKEEFEKWLKTNDNITRSDYNFFEYVSFNMQYGVYVDFFDSVDLYIEIFTVMEWGENIHDLGDWNFIIHYKGDVESEVYGKDYKTRQEAREKAIEKAQSIYNDRNL